MKKKAEIAIAALAVMFVCFSLGYFTGRRSVPSAVSIMPGTVVITPEVEDFSNGGGSAAAIQSAPPSAAPAAAPASKAPETAGEPEDMRSPEVRVSSAEASAPDQAEPAPTPDDPSHYTAEGLLRINYATQKELEALPGIGEVLASRIIEYREQNGQFSRLSSLKLINGIGDARYNAIKDLTTVE